MSTRASKFMSLVLRHDPGAAGLVLDDAGWTSLEELTQALVSRGLVADKAAVVALVAASDKQRFALSEDGLHVRANQGHSVAVDLGLTVATPPPQLFHGTVGSALPGIRRDGLLPRARHAVHLSADTQTATRVGARRGKPVLLTIDALAMHAEGHRFELSANGVWLVAAVPPRFIAVLADE